MEKKKASTAVERSQSNGHSPMNNAHFKNINLNHIQRLVRLLDRSDIAEIELNRAEEGLHLLLRKLKTSGGIKQDRETQYVSTGEHITQTNILDSSVATPSTYCLKAQLVGVFHPWLKPQGKALVAVGDLVKAGQIIGTIEALSLLNEVEAVVAGRVVEICMHDGQLVEYGQSLLFIDPSGEESL